MCSNNEMLMLCKHPCKTDAIIRSYQIFQIDVSLKIPKISDIGTNHGFNAIYHACTI